ncbi:hypothetical protein TSUD_60030 [Trifolium subterraneum]|uniref:Uncharacterized protein n=1 Tax=Trifolium subterraneum TaxID=3900 RepID=A0A2Z6P8U1_TRISU|nr:hypothetical protein TSUD_60030 [Trifolium subterraneum]
MPSVSFLIATTQHIWQQNKVAQVVVYLQSLSANCQNMFVEVHKYDNNKSMIATIIHKYDNNNQ